MAIRKAEISGEGLVSYRFSQHLSWRLSLLPGEEQVTKKNQYILFFSTSKSSLKKDFLKGSRLGPKSDSICRLVPFLPKREGNPTVVIFQILPCRDGGHGEC
jgi:hypothetical protein